LSKGSQGCTIQMLERRALQTRGKGPDMDICISVSGISFIMYLILHSTVLQETLAEVVSTVN
jgi:hypothetical protein